MTVHFDTLYTPDMNDNTSNGFLNFEGYLNSQVFSSTDFAHHTQHIVFTIQD